MRDNIVKTKSFALALRIARLYQYLCKEKHEFILSRQLLRSGTSVGSMVREAEHAETKKDFLHKMAIAQKEINETLYWMELLDASGYLGKDCFETLNNDAIENLKLITAIIKTTKATLNINN